MTTRNFFATVCTMLVLLWLTLFFLLGATKPAFAQEAQQPVVFQTGQFTITDTISTSDNTGYVLKYGGASGTYTNSLQLDAGTASVPFSDLNSGPGETVFGVLESNEGHKTSEFIVAFVDGMLKLCIQAYLPNGTQINQCVELSAPQ